MEYNDLNHDQDNTGTYHATSNLNTAIENPQYDVNNAMTMNINGADNSSYQQQNLVQDEEPTYTFQPDSAVYESNIQSSSVQKNDTMVEGNSEGQQFIPDTSFQYQTTTNNSNDQQQATYEPVMEQNKKNSVKFTIPREFQIVIFIVFIFFIFILLMPYIYDFFKELHLIITG